MKRQNKKKKISAIAPLLVWVQRTSSILRLRSEVSHAANIISMNMLFHFKNFKTDMTLQFVLNNKKKKQKRG